MLCCAAAKSWSTCKSFTPGLTFFSGMRHHLQNVHNTPSTAHVTALVSPLNVWVCTNVSFALRTLLAKLKFKLNKSAYDTAKTSVKFQVPMESSLTNRYLTGLSLPCLSGFLFFFFFRSKTAEDHNADVTFLFLNTFHQCFVGQSSHQ